TIIRPVFGPKTPPPVATKPSPVTAPSFDESPAEFIADAPAQPVDAGQELFCPCGEALMVSFADAGRNVQCPTCLTLMAVDALKDGKGKALRVRAIGKMDQDTWSLNDFA